MDGSIWKVRFAPDSTGNWTYQSSSSQGLLDGQEGNFVVGGTGSCPQVASGNLPDFSCVGRLTYTGGHFLQFDDGSYWLKGGANEPEDLLAPNKNAGFGSKQAAIDYLANKDVNSIYIMLDNIEGDRKNVWPWVGATQDEAKLNHERFDVAKLQTWEDLFQYIQDNGLVLHLVFEDDSGWTGFNRDLYYREMIARFGHHNGLIWDLIEEYNEGYTATEIKDFAQLMRDLDPYDHPLTVHHAGALVKWEPFVGDDRFDLTSFQTYETEINDDAAYWFEHVEASGRTIPLGFDETTRMLTSADRDLFRFMVWSVYAGGGNTEIYTKLTGVGVSYADYADQFDDLTRARKLFASLPYWEMRPRNELVISGSGFVFAKEEQVISVYLPEGGDLSLDLTGVSGSLQGSWFNPRDGSSQTIGLKSGGGIQAFNAPDTKDWVLLLTVPEAEPTATPTPTPTQTKTLILTPTQTATPTQTPSPKPTSTIVPTSSPTATDLPIKIPNEIILFLPILSTDGN